MKKPKNIKIFFISLISKKKAKKSNKEGKANFKFVNFSKKEKV